MMKEMLLRNKIMFWLGVSQLVIFLLLLGYLPFNNVVVLGINSVIKPMKFALSIWLYSWTMGLILNYLNDTRKVRIYSWVAVISMVFEQFSIISQALRGELSHFNRASIYGIILFALMGIFILTLTLWTAYISYIFIKQKTYNLPPTIVLSIKIGLVYFVVFSLFGGYISSLTGHTVGLKDGGEGLWLLNWSTFFGDLRVAHFFGMHSLQIIPLFAIFGGRFSNTQVSSKAVWVFSLTYLAFVLYTMVQGLLGLPFVKV